MATFHKVPDFVEGLAEGEFNLATNTLKFGLSNTDPALETSPPTASGNGRIGNVTQISYANYTDDMIVNRVLENVVSNETSGVYTLSADDVVITASGALPAFRYIYLFDDTSTTPDDQIIGYWDEGSSIALANGETVTLPFSAGILDLT